jgi:hypothetical protein
MRTCVKRGALAWRVLQQRQKQGRRLEGPDQGDS